MRLTGISHILRFQRKNHLDKKRYGKRKRVLCGLIGLQCLLCGMPMEMVSAKEQEDLSLYATSAVLMDAESGRVLYEKNGNQVMAMASTTKIMTCILALEYGNLEDTVEASAYASTMPKVKLYIKKGETYLLKDLLHSLMLESHNDSAVAIAEHIGRQFLSEELQQKRVSEYTTEESKQAVAAFAALMNRKAKELGCENTWFITPNGLDATETITLESGETVTKEHTTTASDLARIMAYCIGKSPKTPEFLTITRTPNYCFSANNRSYSCTNHNAFLNMMDGALSGKTGFTNKAGYCYIGALQRDNRTYIVALLACGWPNNKTYKWSDTRELMEYGLENYTWHTFEEVAFDADNLKPIPVANGQRNNFDSDAYTIVEKVSSERRVSDDSMDSLAGGADQGEIEGLLLASDEAIKVDYQVKEQLEAPVNAGMEVGQITYSVDGVIYRTEKLVITDTIERVDLEWCMEQLLQRFLLR